MGGAGRCNSVCRAAEQAIVEVYLVYVSNIAHVFDSNNIISFVYRSRSLTPFRSQVLPCYTQGRAHWWRWNGLPEGGLLAVGYRPAQTKN